MIDGFGIYFKQIFLDVAFKNIPTVIFSFETILYVHSCKSYFAACRCGWCDYTLELPLGYDYSEGLLNLGSLQSNILRHIFCLVFLGADDFFN